jgi:beta-lactamase regulating signal transducer with metallopeptidase domain
MNDLRLAFEIALRTLAIVAAVEVAQRTLLRDARNVRRLWIAAFFAIAAVALTAVVDWKPSLPRVVTAAAPVRQLAAIDVRTADAQPWEHPRYRRDSREGVFVVYLFGAAGVVLLVGVSLFALRRLRRAASPVSPRIVEIARELGMGCTIAVADVDAPCTVGVLRSVILLPRASGEWPDAKLRAAIAHELAHVRQRDSLWMLFAWAGCAALWFTPAVWIARRRLRAACELASDASAAASVSGGVQVYAKTLIEIAEAAARRLPLAANMAGSVSLADRVEWLVTPRRRVFRVAALLIVPFTLAAFDWQVRLASIDAAKPLLAEVQAPDPEIRARALFRLARWQGRGAEVLPMLLDALGDDAPIGAVPRWNYDRDGWAPARSTLVHPSPGEVAAIGLASLSELAAAPLAERLRDRDPVVRRNAAWALGELRHPRGIGRRQEAALIDALQDGDAIVRTAAAWALGDINVSSAGGPLEKMLARESNPAARREATVALAAVRLGVSSEYFRHKE